MKTLSEFLELYDDDWIHVDAVRNVFGASEEYKIRMLLLIWMWTKPNILHKQSVYDIVAEINLTTPESTPVAAQETFAERLAKLRAGVKAYTPTMVETVCGECGSQFQQPQKIRFGHVVCQDCRDGWRERYVTGVRPFE